MAGRDVATWILAGGRGTRLGAAADRPKPLVEVAGRPFLVYTLEALYRQGLRRVTCLTGHRSDEFQRLLAQEAAAGRDRFLREMQIDYQVEAMPQGTGGALAALAPRLREPLLLLNGDSYCQVDVQALLDLRSRTGAEVSLTAVWVEDAADYGGLAFDDQGRVTGFFEKGRRGAGWVNAGVYALDDALVKSIAEGPCSLERDLLPRWIERRPAPALRTKGLFRDIGTPERLAAAQAEFPPPGFVG